MNYQGILLKKSLSIRKIYSIHYFEYMSDFSFDGEAHDFWEFICVDKGEVGITCGNTYKILKKGEIAFHKPNEFHDVHATGKIAPNLVVVSFECKDAAMDFFRDKILHVDDTERNLLANIIIEARHCFNGRLDDPYLEKITLKPEEQFAAKQLICLFLEHFLIHLLRRYQNHMGLELEAIPQISKSTKNKSDLEIFHRVTDYMEQHLSSQIRIEQICHDNLIGRSQLQKIFSRYCNMGIIQYFSQMKINRAKELIRTRHLNFTQIANSLGYTSVHYFSRQFKLISGMTPSEYASSIKAMAERSF